MTVETSENVSKNEAVTDAPQKTTNNTPSPAQDVRDIQTLLVQGIFPGQVAPAIVKAYNLLEKMAVEIEKQAATPQETK